MKPAMTSKKKEFGFMAIVLCCLLLVTGCMHFSKQKPGEKPDLSQPRQSFYSAPIERFNSGFMNIVTGPVELFYQPTKEITRTSPLQGLLPGIFRGVSWFALREVVGAFEIVTFPIPWKPHLKPLDSDWLHA